MAFYTRWKLGMWCPNRPRSTLAILYSLVRKYQYNLDEDDSEKEISLCQGKEMKLDGFIITLEPCPLTKGIQISNIPPKISPDDIKLKFSDPKIGGHKVTDMKFNSKHGVTNVYFQESSGKNKIDNLNFPLCGFFLIVIP